MDSNSPNEDNLLPAPTNPPSSNNRRRNFKSFVRIPFIAFLSYTTVVLVFELAFQLSPICIRPLLYFFQCLRFCDLIFKWQNYEIITNLKHYARVYLVIFLFAEQLDISFSNLNDKNEVYDLLLHLSEKKYILFRYLFSFVLYFFIQGFILRYDSGNLEVHLLHAFTELADFFILFWEDLFRNSDLDDIIYHFRKPSGIEIKIFVIYNLFLYDLYVISFTALYTLSSKKTLQAAEFFQRRGLDGIYHIIEDILACFLLITIYDYYFLHAPFEVEIGLKQYTSDDRAFGVFVSIIIVFFIVWCIKNYIMSIRKPLTIFNRLRSRILGVSGQLYFLGILDQRLDNNFDQPFVYPEEHREVGSLSFPEIIARLIIMPHLIISVLLLAKSAEPVLGAGYMKQLRSFKRKQIRYDLVLWKNDSNSSNDMALIQTVARRILSSQNNLCSTDQYVTTVRNRLASNGNSSDISQILRELITWEGKFEADWDDFVRKELKKNNLNDPISLGDFQAWVVKAHNNVTSVANTLSSALNVVKGLNTLINVVLIVILGVIIWALLKHFGYAPSLVNIVVIATPLLAASFSFKDTFKNLLERSLFGYAFHPYEIGDLCVIDEKTVEVKVMGLWTTTFTGRDKFGKEEEVIYPNSNLSKMKILKIKSEFDWDDVLEFDLDTTNKLIDINKLKQEIEGEYLKNAKKLHFDPSSHSLTLSRGQNIKLVTRLRYMVGDTKDWSYFKCLQRKDELGAEIYLFTKNIITKYCSTKSSRKNFERQNSI